MPSATMDIDSPVAERKRHRSDHEETPRKKKSKDTKERKEKKHKKDKDEKKHKHKHKHHDKAAEADTADANADTNADTNTNADAFPFFRQTVSLWLPLFPAGFDKPVTSIARQHLDGLVNHYAPALGGYLLAYENVNIGDRSVHRDPKHPATDATPALLQSINEYAVGYGWMTADVDLFVPSRGALLEGKVVLQNEGSIGVTCWDKFNASIEASRLPKGWTYVEEEAEEEEKAEGEGQGEGQEEEGEKGEEGQGEGEEGEGEEGEGNGENEKGEEAKEEENEVHKHIPTGHWVDDFGLPVEGTLRFRIHEFDVGRNRDTGYMAISGTLLSAEEEAAREKAEQLRLQQQQAGGQQRSGGFRRRFRQLPEFGVTQFDKPEEEEDEGQRVEVYKGSLPGTPGD